MEEVVKIVIACSITAIFFAFVAWKLAVAYRIKVVEAKTCAAEEKAREIIDDALKTAETKKKEALLEVKEEALRNKNELERDTKERRAELQRSKRVLQKERP